RSFNLKLNFLSVLEFLFSLFLYQLTEVFVKCLMTNGKNNRQYLFLRDAPKEAFWSNDQG
ncbi:MAG: hypothetical protein ACN6NI_09265, partial [Acinetobacter sp.]